MRPPRTCVSAAPASGAARLPVAANATPAVTVSSTSRKLSRPLTSGVTRATRRVAVYSCNCGIYQLPQR